MDDIDNIMDRLGFNDGEGNTTSEGQPSSTTAVTLALQDFNEILDSYQDETEMPVPSPDTASSSDDIPYEETQEETSEEDEETHEESDDIPLPRILSDFSRELLHAAHRMKGTISEELYDRLLGLTNKLRNSDSLEAELEAQAELKHILETECNYNVEAEISLPLNSPTLLVSDATSRFSGTEWFDEIQRARVILAGLGGIGSWTALMLARMGLAGLCIYDDDIVEPSNMSGQLYSRDDVEIHKVDAMQAMISKYTAMCSVFAIPKKFTNTCESGDIMICGFDNMKARHTFYNSWKRHVNGLPCEDQAKCLYIDGRLSIDTLQVLAITGDDIHNQERYEKEFLFLDAEAEATVCSLKQTSYLACMIGSFIVNIFTNFIANTLQPFIPYDLPFFTEYDSRNMLYRTER